MRASRIKIKRRLRRKRGIRQRVYGTSHRPRLTVFRSLKHIYAQIVDDERGMMLCEASTRSVGLRDRIKNGGNVTAAKIVGEVLAQRAKAKEIETVCFDRNGYRFHGRVKGLADAAKEGGINFCSTRPSAALV